MNKKFSLLLTTCSCLTLLVACGSKDLARDYSQYVELGDYTGLTADRLLATVSDEDLQEQIEADLSFSAEYEEITDRPAQNGDLVEVSFTGTIDGEEFEGGSSEYEEIELGSESYVEGFEEAIVGMNIGESKDFDITFPEDYDGIVDGQTATFHLTLGAIYQISYPDYNDEYIASISEYETVEEYEAALMEQMTQDLLEESQSMACEDILSRVIESSTFNGQPDDLYDAAKADLEAENQQIMEDFGVEDISELFGEDYDQDAYLEESINEQMVVYTIAERENIDVSEEEYQAALEEDFAASEYDSLEEYEASLNQEFYRYQLLRNKVLEFLGDNNTFRDVPEEEYYEEVDLDDIDIETLDGEELDLNDLELGDDVSMEVIGQEEAVTEAEEAAAE